MFDYKILLDKISYPPSSFAEAFFLINNKEKHNDLSSSDLFDTYLWLVFNFAMQGSYKQAQLYLEKIQTNPCLNSEKLKFIEALKYQLQNNKNEILVFSKNEQKLLEMIENGLNEPNQMIEGLYGSSISYERGLNRLKNLVFNIRKKHPHIIHWENGKITKE